MSRFGLIGTITSDHIIRDDGPVFRGLGGILYQAAVFCGLGEDVLLASNCGERLRPEVERLTAPWTTLDKSGLRYVAGPGNQVHLRYSDQLKEREEVLSSVVPPLHPAPILAGLARLDMLLMVFNSGFDIALADWRAIVDRASCPIWVDIHSLVLAKKLRGHREYVAFPDWRFWVAGASHLQANRQEVASLIGRPERWPDEPEIAAFCREAFGVGVQSVFVTMGKDGVLTQTPGESRLVRAPAAECVVDTTGCGDVFCSKTMQTLARGASAFEAAAAGVALASRAAGLAGIQQTYELARGESRREA
jgi:hypothetical protein